jgi:SLA1 homology domain 1, SHD1
VQAGKVWRLRSSDAEVLVAASESALNRLITLSQARDQYGLAELIATRQVSIVPVGTKCLIINPGFMVHEIRILEGIHANEVAFVPVEFVAQEDSPTATNSERQPAKSVTDEKAKHEAQERAAAKEEAKFRTWTSADGKYKREAKLVSYMNGKIILETREGKRATLELAKLTDEDRQYVDRWRQRK